MAVCLSPGTSRPPLGVQTVPVELSLATDPEVTRPIALCSLVKECLPSHLTLDTYCRA
jgi:hypothetical protein